MVNTKREKLVESQKFRFSRWNKLSNGMMRSFLNIGHNSFVISIFLYLIIPVNVIIIVIGLILKWNGLFFFIFVALEAVVVMLSVLFYVFSICFYKTDKGHMNNLLFNQGIKVIDHYLDIVFLIKKLFELENVKNKEEYIRPKLIEDIKVESDEFYRHWLSEQKKPIYTDSENEDTNQANLIEDKSIN